MVQLVEVSPAADACAAQRRVARYRDDAARTAGVSSDTHSTTAQSATAGKLSHTTSNACRHNVPSRHVYGHTVHVRGDRPIQAQHTTCDKSTQTGD